MTVFLHQAGGEFLQKGVQLRHSVMVIEELNQPHPDFLFDLLHYLIRTQKTLHVLCIFFRDARQASAVRAEPEVKMNIIFHIRSRQSRQPIRNQQTLALILFLPAIPIASCIL